VLGKKMLEKLENWTGTAGQGTVHSSFSHANHVNYGHGNIISYRLNMISND